jgi:hypothetical protein
MLGEYIVIAIGLVMYFLPLALGVIVLFIFLKKLGEKILDLVPVRSRAYPLMLPVAEKIVIRKRVIDLKNKIATEVSIEATPEQVRAIFRN